jgi:CrcB protein
MCRVPRYSTVNLLLVAIGGALGSVARYSLGSLVVRLVPPRLSFLGTFSVNIVGCVLFGVIVGLSAQRLAIGAPLRAFLLVGILGGFTTFSGFAFDNVVLLQDRQFALATLNMAGQVVAGVAGLWAAAALTA